MEEKQRQSYRHRTPVQLRFSDVDRFGHVNNAVMFSIYDSRGTHGNKKRKRYTAGSEHQNGKRGKHMPHNARLFLCREKRFHTRAARNTQTHNGIRRQHNTVVLKRQTKQHSLPCTPSGHGRLRCYPPHPPHSAPGNRHSSYAYLYKSN